MTRIIARRARRKTPGAAPRAVTRYGAAIQRSRKARKAFRTKKNRPSSWKEASRSAVRMPAAALVKKPMAIAPDTISSCLLARRGIAQRGGSPRRRRSAADLPHFAGQALPVEPVQVEAAAGLLSGDGGPQGLRDLLVRAPFAQESGEVRLGARKEAGADLTVGSDPDAIAVGAEGLGDGVDETDVARPACDTEDVRRRRGAVAADRHERVELFDAPPDLATGDQAIPLERL